MTLDSKKTEDGPKGVAAADDVVDIGVAAEDNVILEANEFVESFGSWWHTTRFYAGYE